MKERQHKIKLLWNSANIPLKPVSDKDIETFIEQFKLHLPDEMIDYFKNLNGTTGKYDDRLFKLYSLTEFIPVNKKFYDWEGVPNYNNIVNLKTLENCFVFADYSLHLFTYAIRLYPEKSNGNEVYIICGDKYRVIANSFTTFLDYYLNDSPELYYED